MAENRFDVFSKALATADSRRDFLKKAALGVVAAALPFGAPALFDLSSAEKPDGGHCHQLGHHCGQGPNRDTKCCSGACIDGMCGCPTGSTACLNNLTCVGPCTGHNQIADVAGCTCVCAPGTTACAGGINCCGPGEACVAGDCVAITCNNAQHCPATGSCGPAGTFCACFETTEGGQFCGGFARCRDVPACNTTADCPPGSACVISCCNDIGFGNTCVPACAPGPGPGAITSFFGPMNATLH